MSELSISVESVSKQFRLFHERPSSIKERILRMRRSRAVDFWALRDISYDIPEGSTVGLIGANGSGKTTLLKIIGGILRPTRGRVMTRGRIAALLELGAGFHPELTGRENVYLNASILGLSRKDTDRQFDDIVQFSELEEFIDNQVKFYSSGMFMRLGFAVAVHVDPGILLIDEVLAVGDEAFQRKCIDRVREFQQEGRTIVLVTHAVDRVRQICDRAIMLERGTVRASGDVGNVVREFRLAMLQLHAGRDRVDVTREAEITGVELLDAN
jgi:ABC-2 type transport system ATP-binding protein